MIRNRRKGLSQCIRLLTISSLAGIGLIAAEVPESPMRLPFASIFNTAPGPEWTIQTAEGNSIQAKDGALEMRARANTRAHLQMPLLHASFRASATFKYGSPAAPASLRLVWDASNFAQIGLSKAGRIQVREALGNYPHDYDLGPCDVDQWRTFAIELADDCLRYWQSVDGKNFFCSRVASRPARYAAPPKLLIIGNEADTKLFPPAEPWIEPPSSPATGIALVKSVEVRALETASLKASAEDLRLIAQGEKDVVGESLLASGDDPEFASVSGRYPELKWSREAIGVKDNPFAMGVAADGSLQFSPDIANYTKPVAFLQVNDYRFGSGAGGCSKQLYGGWMPIVICRDQYDGLHLEQTLLGYSKDFSPTETLYAYVRLEVVNRAETPRKVQVRIHTRPAPETLPEAKTLELPAKGRQVVCFRLPCGEAQFADSAKGVKTSSIGRLAPDYKQAAESVTAEDFQRKLDLTAGYWKGLIAKGSRFEIPEERVNNAYRAWLAYNFLNVSKRDDVYQVCDGAGFYGRIYGYSAALFCNKLDLLGYHDLAETYLESLLTLVQTNGLLAVNFGSTDTGAALWTMGEHYWITRDAEWLRKMAPRMLQMCGWISNQRKLALEKKDEPAITRGLIRYRPYADLLHPAADYFSNGYLQKGMAAAAAALADIGMRAEAEALSAAAQAYRADILASMEKGIFEDRGMRILPAIPDTLELWKEANGSANGYYGIIVPCMLEAGLPDGNDPKAELLVNALEQRGGLIAGVSRFHNMADHAYAYGYWINRLQRNEVKKAILGLYGSMAYGMSRDTYSAVECTHIQTGENYWTLPHTYSNTQQLRLLRNMLVREDGQNLLLAQAAPRPWLRPGKRLVVKEAPTSFGPVSYSLESGDDGSLRLWVRPPARSTPEKIFVSVRHPEQLKISKVLGKKPAGMKIAGETIEFRQLSAPVGLTLQFK